MQNSSHVTNHFGQYLVQVTVWLANRLKTLTAPCEAPHFFNWSPLLFSSRALERKAAPAPGMKTLLVRLHHGTPQQEDQTAAKPTDGRRSGAGLAADHFSDAASSSLAPPSRLLTASARWQRCRLRCFLR